MARVPQYVGECVCGGQVHMYWGGNISIDRVIIGPGSYRGQWCNKCGKNFTLLPNAQEEERVERVRKKVKFVPVPSK